MDDVQLLEYYAAGWIPSPQESVVAFYDRMAAFNTLQQALSKGEECLESLPFSLESRAPPSLQAPAEQQAAEYYGTVLRGVPVFCSAKKMAPWQAAITWICQLHDDGPLITLIQLHPRFAKSSTLWGWYDREELLTHELAHAGRASFHEPEFEEILAYASAKSAWRRWLGPLFTNTTEAFCMMLLITGIFCLESLVFLFEGSFSTQWTHTFFLFLWMLPIMSALYLFCRLVQRQRLFSRALKALTQGFQAHHPQSLQTEQVATCHARRVLYCMSDQEIRVLANNVSFFAKMAHPRGKEDSLHERLIALLIERGRQDTSRAQALLLDVSPVLGLSTEWSRGGDA